MRTFYSRAPLIVGSQNHGNISVVCAAGNGPKPLSLNTSTLPLHWSSLASALWFLPMKHHPRTLWRTTLCSQTVRLQKDMTGGCWWLEGGLSAGGRNLTGLGSDHLGIFPRQQKVSCLPHQTKRKFGFLKVGLYLCVFNIRDDREGNRPLRVLVSYGT